jgi:hypothetical protein
VSKYFAWNFGVTRVSAPFDNDKTHYDGSYLAAVLGNWVISAGAIEQWWGPSWNSNSLLSNNARPPIGFHIQRNYSEPSKLPVLKWLGPWDFKLFAAVLDDDSSLPKFGGSIDSNVEDVKLTGLSFSLKPHETLELSLRATALWGGEGRTESVSSLFDNFFAQQDCDLVLNQNCSDTFSQNGDRIAGVDLRWRLPVGYPISLYASAYGEDETQLFPSERVAQFGVTSSFQWFGTHLKWYIESTDTTLGEQSDNQLYQSETYPQGYSYYGRSFGSTYGSDSEIVTLGLLTRLNKKHQIKASYSAIDLSTNLDVASDLGEFSQLKLAWEYNTSSFGLFDLELEYSDEIFDDVGRLDDKYRLSLSWTQYLN